MICILADWLKLTLQTSGGLGREYPRESKRDYFERVGRGEVATVSRGSCRGVSGTVHEQKN